MAKKLDAGGVPTRLNQMDVLKYGKEIASLKAGLPPKRWQQIVALAKSQGHTIAGQLSNGPNALKERSNASLRAEAQKTVGTAYAPVTADLNRRDAAAGFLETKRAADDAAYRTWMTGEVDKLDAQARAADATLATQQSAIATELGTHQAAAKADSMQRVAALAGNISDPAQSKALDQSAVDQRSADKVAAARTHTADLTKIGSDANQMSRAALVATAAVREATRTADNWKTTAAIAADRSKAAGDQAKATQGLLTDLKAGEVSKAQKNVELELAAGTLNQKGASLAAQVQEAARTYGLNKAKLDLATWTAQNANTVAQAKVKLGYDAITARDGQHAADAQLRTWIEKFRAKQDAKNKKGTGGVGSDERKLYRQVETVRGLIVREHQRGTDPSKIRQRLRKQGFDDITINVAEDLRLNNGVPSSAGRAEARRLGIVHPGYFW